MEQRLLSGASGKSYGGTDCTTVAMPDSAESVPGSSEEIVDEIPQERGRSNESSVGEDSERDSCQKLQIEYFAPATEDGMNYWTGEVMEDAQPAQWKRLSSSEAIYGTLRQWPAFQGQKTGYRELDEFVSSLTKPDAPQMLVAQIEEPETSTYIRINMSREEFEKKYVDLHGKKVQVTTDSIKKAKSPERSEPENASDGINVANWVWSAGASVAERLLRIASAPRPPSR